MSDKETVNHGGSDFSCYFKPALIFIGAFSVLMTREYVSAKLLMGLVLLDYFTMDLVRKLPLPVCFIIFLALTTVAVT